MSQRVNETPASGRPTLLGRVWTLVRILNVRLRFIFLMVVVGLVAGHWDDLMNRYDRWRRPVHPVEAAAVNQIEYFCPMHPQIIRAEPGNCPICGMPLSQRAKQEREELPEGVLARVQLTPQKIELGRIATSPVQYELLSREIRTVGTVDYDETRRAFIAARIKGRIDQLMVNYVGQRVEKGDPLASIYSPDLLVAQRELLEAADALKQQEKLGAAAPTAATLESAARRKLALWGITPEQIDEIVRRGSPETHLTISAPIGGIVVTKNVLEGNYVNEGDDLYSIADLDRVWIQVQIFEEEIGGIQVGQAVEVTSTAYPAEVFAGRIAFVAFVVDPATRTVAARVEVDNRAAKLKPGMYVRAIMRLPVGRVEEMAAQTGSTTAATTRGQAAPQVAALAQAYLELVGLYAQDKTDPAQVTKLVQAAKTLAGAAEGPLAAQATGIAERAARLAGKDLKAQRALLSDLSSRAIELLRAAPPDKPTLFIAHCPMVNADWLQTTETIANPYYGSEMLTCGSITGRIGPDAGESETYATGYFCPIYPNRLFREPRECPIDGFPIKRVKIEKVLAVPVSAVIDTGAHRVVYRETAPGTFEMVAVTLGLRAGEYYPVLAGLSHDERVATVGTFLVDAENRLNPGAASQYFGATGSPQDADRRP